MERKCSKWRVVSRRRVVHVDEKRSSAEHRGKKLTTTDHCFRCLGKGTGPGIAGMQLSALNVEERVREDGPAYMGGGGSGR